jgi:Protein of unknown function (DUF2721)
MNAEMVAGTIQLIIAPVVMVTACALILNGILARYAGVNDRLRALSRERFDLVRMGRAEGLADEEFFAERLEEIDEQVPQLVRHHKLLHDGLLAVYAAVLVYVADMFIIAVAVASDSSPLAVIALLVFLGGTAVLLVGILLTALEVRTSHQAVQVEAARVRALMRQSRKP